MAGVDDRFRPVEAGGGVRLGRQHLVQFQEKVAAMIDAKRAGETVERPSPCPSRPAWSTSRRPCAPTNEDLSGLPKDDLYKMAAADIPGCSHMTRDDLVKALSPSRT